MIKFRQKKFTIPEGHYTGPKDVESVPGTLEMIGKGALGGGIIGGIAGKLMKDSTILEGALTGGKYGALGGIVLKLFLNYLHNPMTKVKFSEVDKNIRRQFGIYRVSGVTVGDSIDKRATVDERFGFNDRNVTDYKINIAVHNDTVTMYTFGMTNDELNKTSKILDYYTKKYHGMDYSASLINQKLNSYSVCITFTNYQVMSNFIMELSSELGTRINLLDNKVIVSSRIEEATKDKEEEKTFSVKPINKYDLISLLGKGGSIRLPLNMSWKQSLGWTAISMINSVMSKFSNDELVKSGAKAPREMFSNVYLEDTLKKLHYIEGFNYTIGDKSAFDNISMNQGRFIVTTLTGSDSEKQIDLSFYDAAKSKITRTETGKVTVYVYAIESRKDFEFLLKKLMSTKITFNIFDGK